MKTTRKISQPYIVAAEFCKSTGRDLESLPVEQKQIILAQSKHSLAKATLSDIIGCLSAFRAGVIGNGLDAKIIQTPAFLWRGAPCLMSQWLEYKETPPPVWMQETYAEWVRLCSTDSKF